MSPRGGILLEPLDSLPEVIPGDDLASLLADAVRTRGLEPRSGDVLVVCQKIVSKAEGRLVALAGIEPSAEAHRLAAEEEKDPRLLELVLRESRRIVRRAGGRLIVETPHGLVCANAGIDASNAPGEEVVVLLPRDPDASAAALHRALAERWGVPVAIVITDTFGRPFREGQVDVAIGAAGLRPLTDLRGTVDRGGRPLRQTVLGTADALAAAAGLLMEKAGGVAAVWVRGAPVEPGPGRAAELVRPRARDLFR